MKANERIELMKELAIKKGYEIKESRTPAYDLIHAVKGNVEIHIASLSHSECKLANQKQFEESLDNPKDFETYVPMYDENGNLH